MTFQTWETRDQMTRCTEFVTILAPLQVGCFRISRFIPDELFSNKAQIEFAENQALSRGVSAILQSGLILENIRRMFFAKIHVHCSGDPD